MSIYLDYSATTPCRIEAIEKIQSVLTSTWGNPSSLHSWGERAATVLEESRLQVAALINATPETIVFTSGGTEADNLAISGIAQTFAAPQHMIISAVEHAAISQPAQILRQQGWEISMLPVGPTGRVNPKALHRMLRKNTVLISVVYGQSEVGSIQPINTLGAIAHEHGILFHTDAVQAAGRVPIDVSSSPIDLLSLSSHKIYGPQGAGALYVRSGTPLNSLTRGGSQEQSLRPGTQALPAIAGFGVAADYALRELDTERQRLTQLRELLFQLLADEPALIPTGDRIHRLPHHVSFCIQSSERFTPKGRDIVRALGRAGIGISAGSACNSGKTVPSRILQAMGLSDAMAQSGIRLTLGKQTRRDQIEAVAQALRQAVRSGAPKLL